ncbi:MAG: dicarboxylate/amino acid:cation symporter [Treponema sp.]|nr:dicarboxylate/amino acid:cation symporter [Treponema sp.]
MKLFNSLPFRLLVALAFGIALGSVVNETVITVIGSIRHISGQIVFFAVPLIILGSIAPSIARMGQHASRLLGFSLVLAYLSVVGAGFFSMFSGRAILPFLSIADAAAGARSLPNALFVLNIPQIMPVMSALVLAILAGLAVVWTKSKMFASLLEEFQQIVLVIVRKVIIPILPIFIGATFATLAYQGRITVQLPVFLQVIGIIVIIHVIWIAVLYVLGTIYSRRNPLEVIRHYGPAYLTAFGTMSSAATLPVALRSASSAKNLDKNAVNFGIPLFAHIHMPGSVISIVFLALTVSQVLYGSLPPLETMLVFVPLLAIFAVAAPGVPGGTLMASLGLITAVLGFDEVGTSLMLAIFALQDSFGTACNITSDGPMMMTLSRYTEKNGLTLEKQEAVFN